MTANPLNFQAIPRAGKVTREMLEELAAKLNRSAFVINHGWHYFVGQRFIDGVWKAELNRSDSGVTREG